MTENNPVDTTASEQELPEGSQPKLQNLFRYDRPILPELFVGRKAEVETILSRLQSPKDRGGSFIYGVHGIGKTSLLNYLKSPLAREGYRNLAPSKARFVLLPGEIITGFVEKEYCTFVFEDLRIWFEELIASGEQVPPSLPDLQQRVEILLSGLNESGTSPALPKIGDFFSRLGRAGLLCTVLLDNLGVLFGRIDPDKPDFFIRLKALLQKPDQPGFSLVTTSQKSADELFREAKWGGSRFDATMEHVALKGFSETDVEKLIEVCTQHIPADYQFNHDERLAIQTIREETDGHPGKIQQAAYLLLEQKLGLQEESPVTHDNILEDHRFKVIARLVLDEEAVETDPAESVVAQPTIQKQASLVEWHLPEWFEPLSPYCEALLDEYPNFSENVFVMMKFAKNDKILDKIYNTIKETLCLYGLNALRADERHYTNQLWDNVLTYMLCCKYGIAVLENIHSDEFNPNVALEYGFMSALNRTTMLLIESRFKHIRADITGTIAYTFDGFEISEVAEAVNSWAQVRLGLSVPDG